MTLVKDSAVSEALGVRLLETAEAPPHHCISGCPLCSKISSMVNLCGSGHP